jgi:hypothetical protein
MIRADCLCGSVAWSVAGPLPPMYHCHCARCPKAHGAAFATYVDAPVKAVALVGLDAIATCPPAGEGARRRAGRPAHQAAVLPLSPLPQGTLVRPRRQPDHHPLSSGQVCST